MSEDDAMPGDAMPEIDLDSELQALIEADRVRAKPGAIAVIVTPVAKAEDLSALMGLSGVDGEVLGTDEGAIVWQRIEDQGADEFDALLGDERPVPPAIDALAKQMSRIVPYGVVVLLSWLEEGALEPGVSGQMTACRYYAGAYEESLPAGLILNTRDPLIEDLLLGRVTPEDVAEERRAHPPTRLQALKYLGRLFGRGPA